MPPCMHTDKQLGLIPAGRTPSSDLLPSQGKPTSQPCNQTSYIDIQHPDFPPWSVAAVANKPSLCSE